MNKFLVLFMCFAIIISCETNKKNESNDKIEVEKESYDLQDDFNAPKLNDVPVLKKCYRYSDDELKAELNLELDNNDVVIGTLSYKGSLNQNGNVIGEFEGDTLFLTYKYFENDTPIIKQIFLLKNEANNTFQKANNETLEDTNTNQKVADIVFDGFVFEKYDCQQIE